MAARPRAAAALDPKHLQIENMFHTQNGKATQRKSEAKQRNATQIKNRLQIKNAVLA